MKSVLRQLHRVALRSGAEGLSDVQLLSAFLTHRDEAAFDALLRRHGPMVMGVCRRMLRNTHDAEDAFQATFLVLARKAESIRTRQVLASWLYGVAYRTASQARKAMMKRREKERERALHQVPQDAASEELLQQLDHELSRLKDKYRVPVVLCELEGKSRREAARMLDLAEGTLSWRLAYAKKLLARRLSRFGTVAVGAMFAESVATARLSPILLKTTAQAALAAGAVPAQVMSLTQEVLKAMLLTKLKITFCAAGLMLLAGIGATELTYRVTAQEPRQGVAQASRPQADELEALRLEFEAMRKELRATRERVKALEGEVIALKGQRPSGGSVVHGSGSSSAPAVAGTPSTDHATTAAPVTASSGVTSSLPGGPAITASGAALSPRSKTAADPLTEAEAALKKLRRDPSDKEAAEALERALQRLKREKPRASSYERK